MNKERCQLLLETIERHPDHFTATAWARPLVPGKRPPIITKDSFAEVALCFAGWAVILFHGPLVSIPTYVRSIYSGPAYVPQDEPHKQIGVLGRELLGLTSEEAIWLFFADQETALDDLRKLIAEAA